MAATTSSTRTFAASNISVSQRGALRLIVVGLTVALVTMIAIVYVAPFTYMLTTSFKSAEQLTDTSMFLPETQETIQYQGQALPLYYVPVDGQTKKLALLKSKRSSTDFVDPANLTADPINLPVRAAALQRVTNFDPQPNVYSTAVDEQHLNFPRALSNTLAVTLISALGAVTSAALVAYGFSRFRIPGINILFMILMATIILPPQVTLIPTFIFFQKIGWTGTLLPLIVPHFFANAYNVFLLRQYFVGIPREMDEAATVDGAGPFQTFMWIIVPQARMALVTVVLFHFLVIWGEFQNALIYTAGSPAAQPLSVALQRFTQLYSTQPNQMMAGAVLTMLIPLIVFFLAQKQFMQGIVISGVEK
ncbi:MAG: carbohydrate ABC transporter permease [Anaerolineae bacterium]|nr:carbohydrate ABC transporter permease [Anaerolineae bacterium]